jgi:3-dehydroquinate dehydratase I
MVKATSRPYSVGVIFSEQDLQRALRLRKPPDLFELRLDGLLTAIRHLPATISQLHAPIIITARAPIEGGANNLSLATRRKLLTQFLPHATFLDIELSSARALSVLRRQARSRKLQIILSLHDLTATPTLRVLRTATRQAHSLGADIFKVATRTDRAEDLHRLLELVRCDSSPLPVSAMGFGTLGRASRALLARAGSVLNYAHLGHPTTEGQWSLAQLRAAIRAR